MARCSLEAYVCGVCLAYIHEGIKRQMKLNVHSYLTKFPLVFMQFIRTLLHDYNHTYNVST